ncbi:MAG: DUF362 domain-containing protein [bacterium]
MVSRTKDKISLSRRDFLKTGTAASLGLMSGALWMPRAALAAANETSRVVIVTDETVLEGSLIRQDVVRVMIDEGLRALTDAATPPDAWMSILPDLAADLAVGIKVNTINGQLASHPETAYPLAASLADVSVGGSPYPENQITIWDRQDAELLAAGYTLNDTSFGVKCFGTDHAGIGFHPSGFYASGEYQEASRCYTDYSDALINLSVLKNAGTCGMTFSLKNLFGGISNPWDLHDNACDPGIPAANAELFTQFGSRQKLCICDAIFGCISGGPLGAPNLEYKGIVLSQDPVALDIICRQILEDNGCTTGVLATYLATASAPPYNLGNSDLADIEIVEISNPTGIAIRGQTTFPQHISLKSNYPEPFNSSTTIPVYLEKPQQIRLTIHDVQGRRMRTLYDGSMQAGEHRISWDGSVNTGHSAASGRYIVKLQTGKAGISRQVTLLR